ncbi:ABC transporter permease [Kineosporia rhizophila]|uniref:ABC transporter permease n=1 Tax=Kineosporia TaxID=49184 RepID=UPI001E488324|nr:ABC transporter permease [Kineosporia sp. NBRC 101677]MCE0534774.1 ABC transporter permease [Kineosporia rhizophila]GLY19299.1 transport permease protein [Kineosporia sp. NBRC 101677]
MSARRIWATAHRVLQQLAHDRRTVALLVLFPSVLMVLLRYVLDEPERFDRAGPALIGIFPFTVMFLVSSVVTLRERRDGTLERLMTMPLGRADLLLGYALAFGLTALLQVGILVLVTVAGLGLDVASSAGLLIFVAALNALLGTALGLFTSAFASSEFQAVQFMPLVVMPQVLLCGLFVPREAMNPVLEAVSAVFPLSYAVEAVGLIAAGSNEDLARDLGIVATAVVLALGLGAVTLRRRTA